MSFALMMNAPAATIVDYEVEHQARMRTYEAQTVVRSIYGQPVTLADFRTAFEAVENKDHWKGPIDATLTGSDPVELQFRAVLTKEAICHYHGDRPSLFWAAGNKSVQIVGRGYVC